MKKLHRTQVALLKILKKNQNNPLTIRELGEEIDEPSPGVVHHHLVQLEKKGYLKRNPNNPRDYVVLDSPENKIVYLNKYGVAKCGPDGFFFDENLIETVPIASTLLKFPAADAFIVEARGDSMETKIFDGDIIIARRTHEAAHGDIVVCTHQGEVKIKRFEKAPDSIFLTSLNKKYTPILIRENDLIIEGVVKNILHYD